jgi:iron complex outermembrane recepter protein
MKSFTLFKLALLAGAAAGASAAFAQDQLPAPSNSEAGAASNVDEIVVTALRRDTTLQRTPAAVTALSGSELASRGISNVEDLAAAVPAVTFGKNIGQAHIAIRGIGSDGVVAGQDPRVGFYQDGVYISRPDAQVAGMFDVASVQVLKGPQGTLYGRNSTGGAVVVTSALPTFETDGYLRAGYGNYNAVDLQMAVGGPVSDTFAVRFAGHYQRHDGYGKNIVTGTDIDDKDEMGVRVSFLWKPSENIQFLTIADYSYESDRANGLHYFGTAEPFLTPRGVTRGGSALVSYRDIASDIDPKVKIKTYGLVEQITYDAGWSTFKSVTAYRKVTATNLVDIDGTTTQLGFDKLFTDADQFSQELTINGKADRLSWLVGGQYLYEDIGPVGGEIPLSQAILGGPFFLADGFNSIGWQKTQAFGFYGQLSYEIVDGLTITGGGRYSTEKKKLRDDFQLDFSRNAVGFNTSHPYIPGFADFVTTGGVFPRTAQQRWSRFTPTGTIEYQVNPDIFAYFTYSQGFKSGGYAIGAPQPAFKPEKITSYEGGIKTTFMGGVVTANLIGFHYDYSDLQVTLVRNNVSATENAASAKVDGLEGELILRPTRRMTIGGNIAYVDGRYSDFLTSDPSNPRGIGVPVTGKSFVDATGNLVQDLSGNRMSQAPKISALIYASNTWQFGDNDVTLRGEYNYKSKQYFTPFENNRVKQNGYGIAAASLRIENAAGWSVEGYIRNITNKKAIAQVYVSSFGLFDAPVLGTSIAPRTYGATLGYKF